MSNNQDRQITDLEAGDHVCFIYQSRDELSVLCTEFAKTGLAYFSYFGGLYPAYVRGQACLKAKRETEAAVEFQKLEDHPGLVLADPIGVMARLQLARIFALSGATAKAEAAYQEVLTLWKDADSDLPVINQARAEYAKLQQAKK